jgi:hypothetical protein
MMKWLSVDALKPNARNARTHSKKQIRQIADSIAAFGFLVPILIDEGGLVIAGHGRYAAAKLLGLAQVPVIEVQGLSEAKRRALALADNKIGENAGWDREILAAELPELAEILVVEGLDVSITGFSAIEIDQLAVDFEEDASDPHDAMDPEWLTAAPVSKLGDLWELGSHRVLCGDARNADHVARLMGRTHASMAFLDPPYNVRVRDIVGRGQVKHTEFAMASGELSRSDFIGFLKSTLTQAAAVSRDGAVHYVCMDWRHVGELIEAGGMIYGEMLNLAVWVKSNAGQGSFYRSQHELIGIFRVGAEAHLNNIELGRHGRSRSNVWHYAGINTFHRARPLRWVRNDPPGSGARGTAGLHARDRAPLRRRRHQALANLFGEGCRLRPERPELRRNRKHARHGVRRGPCAGSCELKVPRKYQIKF